MPSAPRAFTDRITGVGGAVDQRERLQPARRVLRQQQPQLALQERAPRRSVRPPPAPGTSAPARPAAARRRRRPTAADDGGVRLVGPARQLEVDRPGGRRAGRARGRRTAPRSGVGRRKPQSPQNQSSPGRCSTPPQDGQDQASSFHILAGRDPHHVRAGGGGPHDQRVVRVGDHDGLGAGQALAPVLGQHPGLGGAVELVAGEVEQRDGLRRRRPGRPRRGTSRRPR